MDLSMYCFFWETESLGTIQACNSANSSTPLRTRTRIEVSFFLNDSCRTFWTPLFPFLNGDLNRPELPIRSSSTISPVWRKSPVHSSAVEVPFRHSMERTVGDFWSGLVLGWTRSMGIFGILQHPCVESRNNVWTKRSVFERLRGYLIRRESGFGVLVTWQWVLGRFLGFFFLWSWKIRKAL